MGSPSVSPTTARAPSPKGQPVIVKRKVVSGIDDTTGLSKSGSKKKPKEKKPKGKPSPSPSVYTEPRQKPLWKRILPRALTFDRSHVTLIAPQAKSAAEGLGLTQRDLRTLRASFTDIDFDESGAVDPFELLDALQARERER